MRRHIVLLTGAILLAGCGTAATLSAGGESGNTYGTYPEHSYSENTEPTKPTKPPKPPHTYEEESTTTKPPTPSLFSVKAVAFCGSDFLPEIAITFGNRPDLDGQRGVLSFSTGGSVFLVFQSNQTVNIPYPNTTQNVNLIYSLGQETATASVTYPPNCPPATTTTKHDTTTSSSTAVSTTSTTVNGVTTSTTSTTINGTTTTSTTVSPPGVTTTTVTPPVTPPPAEEVFVRAAGTECQTGVPKIRIDFGNEAQFDGRVGTLTMSDINGRVLSVQPLTYVANTTVFLLYPGSAVDPVTGEVTDVPGWNLNSDGFWVQDPSDAILREGINLLYEVNPSATAFVTYPPESSGCATPTGPFPPAPVPQPTPPHVGIPVTK